MEITNEQALEAARTLKKFCSNRICSDPTRSKESCLFSKDEPSNCKCAIGFMPDCWEIPVPYDFEFGDKVMTPDGVGLYIRDLDSDICEVLFKGGDYRRIRLERISELKK